jgi:phospholipase C
VLHAHARSSHGELSVDFDNPGRAGAVLHVYDRLHLDRLPRRYTIEAGKSLSDTWDTRDDDGRYDLWILGPNGFLRHFTGGRHLFEIELRYHASDSALELVARARGAHGCALVLSPNSYGSEPGCRLQLEARGHAARRWSLRDSARWYDFSVTSPEWPGWSQRFAGRLENGRDGFSDPALDSRP